jgi:UDP-galactopyranose mutase
MKGLVAELVAGQKFRDYIEWYYTPMMLDWSEQLDPLATIYDCMDELSAFKNAPEKLKLREAELFGLADLVFTGGRSLYEVKRDQHNAVYCFPSSIDVAHFARALEDDPARNPTIRKISRDRG